MNRLPSMHHDYERAFASKEVNEQLEKGVYGEGLRLSLVEGSLFLDFARQYLIYIPQRIQIESGILRHYTGPRRCRVYWDPDTVSS